MDKLMFTRRIMVKQTILALVTVVLCMACTGEPDAGAQSGPAVTDAAAPLITPGAPTARVAGGEIVALQPSSRTTDEWNGMRPGIDAL